tara:strand:- start:49 stop:225 length:177 start_codon:yes stop_codon:yes gene_type:complete
VTAVSAVAEWWTEKTERARAMRDLASAGKLTADIWAAHLAWVARWERRGEHNPPRTSA